MGVYANSLDLSLRQNNCEVSHFTPQAWLERYKHNVVIMRYLRYIHYPRLVARQFDDSADVHHVIDHGYAHLLPKLPSGKRVVSVHDLIPLLTWKGALASEPVELGQPGARPAPTRKPLLNLHSLGFLSGYDQIISSSESTARDLVTHLGIERELIAVVPPALQNIFSRASDHQIESFRQQYGFDSATKWLLVSGRQRYKNHATCLRVFKQLLSQVDASIGLIKTGLPSPEFEALVRHHGLEGNVRSLFIEKHSDLPVLYSMADCLLFPSLYEGFGIPVAEALACGTPAVVSNRGSLPEVAGKLIPALDAFDVDGLAEAVQQALFDQAYQQHIAQQAPPKMQRYSIENVGRQVAEIYQAI